MNGLRSFLALSDLQMLLADNLVLTRNHALFEVLDKRNLLSLRPTSPHFPCTVHIIISHRAIMSSLK